MSTIVLIVLSLTTGNAAPTIASHCETHQNRDGSYTVRYASEKSSIGNHDRPWERGQFTADEGANGIMPTVMVKRF